MTLMLNLFFIGSLFELIFTCKPFWGRRQPLAIAVIVVLVSATIGVLLHRFSLGTSIFALITIYRIVNLSRVVANRSEAHYLQRSTRLSTLTLLGMQVVVLITLGWADQLHPTADHAWTALAIAQLAVASVLFASTQRHLRTTLPTPLSQHFSDSQLPSLSVCIPARNETTDLEECLHSILASDYPKLEVIVLDDCSQGKHVSDIVRSFAHDGVRFIQGTPTPDSWLSKNWAYQQLFEATSGKLVAFCGVDVRFETGALREIVTTQIAKEKRMVSVIPRNILPHGFKAQFAILIQPVRYAWELAPPRRLFNRPPVLSSCWVAEHALIDRTGTFAAVKRSVTPEAYFARKAIQRDGYTFIQSTPQLGISSVKSWIEQRATAVRTQYPQLRRRPELVLLMTMTELGLLIAPLPMAITGLVQGLVVQTFAATMAIALVWLTYAQIVTLTYQRRVIRGFILTPIAALFSIYIRHESMLRYEFGSVIWKGRNVCLPVMRVIPRLPSMHENLQNYRIQRSHQHRSRHQQRRT